MSGDFADRASEREDNDREGRIRLIQEKCLGMSRVICIDCGGEIPPERRKAVVTERCTDCQQGFEFVQSRGNRAAA